MGADKQKLLPILAADSLFAICLTTAYRQVGLAFKACLPVTWGTALQLCLLASLVCLSILCLQYAERLPIGKEDIIQGIPASKVLAFYKRWYRPENMAVIAVGDFADPQAVVGMIEHHMAKCQASRDNVKEIPRSDSCMIIFSYFTLKLHKF